jgi:hypothetical protein
LPPGEHAALLMQDTQLPPLQTLLVPQGVPSETLVRPVHVALPVAQEVVPFWQALPVAVQVAPAVHETHDPLAHTMFVPHAVPSAALVPWSVQ